MKARWCRYTLHFHETAITSRSVMHDKTTYFLKIQDDDRPGFFGLGECALFRGLGADDRPDYEEQLDRLCRHIEEASDIDLIERPQYSSIRFGLETALLDLKNGGKRIIFDTPWSRGKTAIAINGLIWMGTAEKMMSRIREKLSRGFRCLKLKIGGVKFEEELELLRYIRDRFPKEQLELRLDANGAFTPENAMARLEALSQFAVHSIEQPIKPKQWEAMKKIAAESPIPIALDEEFIGTSTLAEKKELLSFIMPQYIILKPSLCGGLSDSNEWIDEARKLGIGWWGTSALESNVGLNAIAQWLSTYPLTLPQGLGTGALYTDNIPSPLFQPDDVLRYNPSGTWDLSALDRL